MASVWLGPPMTACQSVTDNWLAMGVEVRSARCSMRSRRSASGNSTSMHDLSTNQSKNTAVSW